MQFYTDPSRESDAHSLPDAETLELRIGDGSDKDRESYHPQDFGGADGLPVGWYWRTLGSDGDPIGPFDSEALAIADARCNAADDAGATILDGSQGIPPNLCQVCGRGGYLTDDNGKSDPLGTCQDCRYKAIADAKGDVA